MVQDVVVWEVEDNYQKQTFRNRCHICTDRGRHLLSIPIRHVGGADGRQKYKEVKLDNDYPWQRQHWRTLQTAYRTSPFFEFYEDDLAPLFEKKHRLLLDFNLLTIETICNCLQIEMPWERTTSYKREPATVFDARFLVNAKSDFNFSQKEYVHVFGTRHGFIKNTSILDLLFNEGPNSTGYLKSQDLTFPNA